jgi:uncharacterized repeat protein (TIGR03803 family)
MDGEESMNCRNLWFQGSLLLIAITVLLAPGALAQSKYKTLYKFTGGADGRWPAAGLIRDQAGNLYGTTLGGGAHSQGTAFELTPNSDGSWTESVLYSFCPPAKCDDGDDGAGPEAGLTFYAGGNLYGTTIAGGYCGLGTVYQLTPSNGGWAESVLYSYCGSDGSGPYAGVTFDSGGNLYGTTLHTVYELTPSNGGWTESVLHTFCSLPHCNDGDDAKSGLIFDPRGNLYGTTFIGGKDNAGVVFKLAPSGSTWTFSVLYTFTGGRDGRGPYVGSLIMDAMGNLYGTTTTGGIYKQGTVFKLSQSAGKWKETVLHSFANRDGSYPMGSLIFDLSGNLYGMTTAGGDLSRCAGKGCGVVFKLMPNSKGGWTETVLHRFLDGPGAFPLYGLIFDPAGNLYGTTQGDETKTFGSVFEITP